jgi:diphthamide synthase (EF-2-diphthine--ammonia ligase)
MHGVRRELLTRQADALGIQLVEIRIPPACVNEVYEARMAQAFASPPLSGVEAVAFGDLFLEDVLAAGFRAIIACVDPRALDASFAGRTYDEQLLADLPAGVDPCGENGEFHTFVHTGPIFTEPISCEIGEVVERGGFVFCDLMPA